MTENGGYPVFIRPMTEDEGGGYLATVPDLPGCMSDGETPQEAAKNVQDAIASWVEAAERLDQRVPAPNSATGQWRQRVPRTVHLALKQIARSEGVSLNALVSSILSKSVGRHEAS